jgi:ataxia telangiectasia mutated family protein
MSAFDRYHPSDMKQTVISAQMKDLQENYGNDPERMLKFFLETRKKFRPVLRHYFTEKHKNPINWFQMRLCYTRSIATTSIVGHILGLGDRHSSNILMDNVTGEAVHIDLGIAFDQVWTNAVKFLYMLLILNRENSSPSPKKFHFG